MHRVSGVMEPITRASIQSRRPRIQQARERGNSCRHFKEVSWYGHFKRVLGSELRILQGFWQCTKSLELWILRFACYRTEDLRVTDKDQRLIKCTCSKVTGFLRGSLRRYRSYVIHKGTLQVVLNGTGKSRVTDTAFGFPTGLWRFKGLKGAK